jgi:hypothetical protein
MVNPGSKGTFKTMTIAHMTMERQNHFYREISGHKHTRLLPLESLHNDDGIWNPCFCT